MRDVFPEHFRPTQAQFEELWRNALFSFDTNVLLAPYRLNEATRVQLLRVLRHFKDRIWIPHQVALEYLRGRPGEVADSKKRYGALKSDIADAVGRLRSSHPRHAYLDLDAVWSHFAEAIALVEQAEARHPDLWDSDTIQSELAELFAGRVGPALSSEAAALVSAEGKQRYERKQPPGWRDAGKGGERQYGDLIAWMQLVEQAKKQAPKPWIFVTEDRKDDWWQKVGERTVGPDPQLIAEMRKEANVVFYMYSLDQFLNFAGEYVAAEKKALERAAEDVRSAARERHRRQTEVTIEAFKRLRAEAVASIGSLYDRNPGLLEKIQGATVPPEVQAWLDRQNAETARLREQVGQLKLLGDVAKMRELYDTTIGRGLPEIPAELFLKAYSPPATPAAIGDVAAQSEGLGDSEARADDGDDE
jgi:hypothetical protein